MTTTETILVARVDNYEKQVKLYNDTLTKIYQDIYYNMGASTDPVKTEAYKDCADIVSTHMKDMIDTMTQDLVNLGFANISKEEIQNVLSDIPDATAQIMSDMLSTKSEDTHTGGTVHET